LTQSARTRRRRLWSSHCKEFSELKLDEYGEVEKEEIQREVCCGSRALFGGAGSK
jgi:hypothetical protein